MPVREEHDWPLSRRAARPARGALLIWLGAALVGLVVIGALFGGMARATLLTVFVIVAAVVIIYRTRRAYFG